MEAATSIKSFRLLWICTDCRKRLHEILDVGKRVKGCIEKAEQRIRKAVTENKKESEEEVEKKVDVCNCASKRRNSVSGRL